MLSEPYGNPFFRNCFNDSTTGSRQLHSATTAWQGDALALPHTLAPTIHLPFESLGLGPTMDAFLLKSSSPTYVGNGTTAVGKPATLLFNPQRRQQRFVFPTHTDKHGRERKKGAPLSGGGALGYRQYRSSKRERCGWSFCARTLNGRNQGRVGKFDKNTCLERILFSRAKLSSGCATKRGHRGICINHGYRYLERGYKRSLRFLRVEGRF